MANTIVVHCILHQLMTRGSFILSSVVDPNFSTTKYGRDIIEELLSIDTTTQKYLKGYERCVASLTLLDWMKESFSWLLFKWQPHEK